ncbi:uncharacterized protein LOC106872865 [Octopus bimaculoides]|uniref:uncharacterized protein LOC106872865 n=1 Tax=Octopus bimaculoides TaxID=37653 RepID=UPI00071DCF99|nr:uncharacterized protein LOC106872865 [Octopus bimaculoides]|eukprot:XP_014775489.1 PREDICTED: uncharacterized protein LOC106872865 [Octopus bimaculoides]
MVCAELVQLCSVLGTCVGLGQELPRNQYGRTAKEVKRLSPFGVRLRVTFRKQSLSILINPFTIESYSGRTTITDLLATTENDQPKCGHGKFSVRPGGYLYQPGRCPSVVSFGSKKSLRKVQFQWTPPRCACATIRITVKSIQGFYYSGNTPDDALYRSICPKDMTLRKPAKIPMMTLEEEVTKMKRESLSQLCHHVEEERTSDSFPVNFLEPRQLNDLEKSDPRWDILQLALEQRRIEVQTCCGITDTFNRQECFEDIRRNRIDQLCGDGYPAVPYAKHRESWMSTRQETCCYELAESRYECFAKNSAERSSHSPDHIAFFDETHPLVDLEYYQTNPLANTIKMPVSVALKDFESVNVYPRLVQE